VGPNSKQVSTAPETSGNQSLP